MSISEKEVTVYRDETNCFAVARASGSRVMNISFNSIKRDARIKSIYANIPVSD